MEILKVENLTKIYGKDMAKVTALDNVSFSVKKGEFVAIVGASGSGKSTLLHIIGGVDRPTSGKVYIDGKDIFRFNDDKLAIFRRRQVGLIYQFYNLIPILNVEENITLPLALDNRDIDKRKLDEMIKLLGLENRKTHLPNELSGGQQQRTSIGRALITNPTIILADEPTGNLDSKSSDEIVALLKKSNKEFKQTIIMITHNMEIAKCADRIIKIEDGKIVKEVKKMNLLNRLTIKNLKLNKKRTLVTIIGIMLSVALVTAVATMYSSCIKSLINFETYQKGNFHVAFYDVPINEIETIKNNRGVDDIYLTKNIGYAKL